MTQTAWKREEQAATALRELYRRYGYTPYKMSQFEEYDLYVRNKDFLLSDQIITFSDGSGRLLALKPDVTLSIVKNAPEEPGGYEIAEAVLLAVKSLKLLGGRYKLNLSHMGLIAAVLSACNFTPGEKKQAMDCLRQKNAHDLKRLCGDNGEAWKKLEALVACGSSGQEALRRVQAVLTTSAEQQALAELSALWNILEDPKNGLRLDFSVGSDLGYYSGVVFRGYLEGIPESVLSGGQ